MNLIISKKPCTTCGDNNFDRVNVIYYNKGTFCSQKCKDEDVKRSEMHAPTINYHRDYVPMTLMMNSTSGRK